MIYTHPKVGEEFVPLPNWTDIKKRYNVKADGSFDDTKGLQDAFDELGTNGVRALYGTEGKYILTDTVTLRNKQGVAVMFEHPQKVEFIWRGAKGKDMFNIHSTSHSRFGRAKLNAMGIAKSCINQDHSVEIGLDGKEMGYFDTANKFEDIMFVEA